MARHLLAWLLLVALLRGGRVASQCDAPTCAYPRCYEATTTATCSRAGGCSWAAFPKAPAPASTFNVARLLDTLLGVQPFDDLVAPTTARQLTTIGASTTLCTAAASVLDGLQRDQLPSTICQSAGFCAAGPLQRAINVLSGSTNEEEDEVEDVCVVCNDLLSKASAYLPQLPALAQQLLKSPQLTKQGFISVCKPALDAFLGIAVNPGAAKPTDVANLACPTLKRALDLMPALFTTNLESACQEVGSLLGLGDIPPEICKVPGAILKAVGSAANAETLCSSLLPPLANAYGSAGGPWWEQEDWNAVFPFGFLVPPLAAALTGLGTSDVLCGSLATVVDGLQRGLTPIAVCGPAGFCGQAEGNNLQAHYGLLSLAAGFELPDLCNICTQAVTALPALIAQAPGMTELLKSPQLTKQSFNSACTASVDSLLRLALRPGANSSAEVAGVACPALRCTLDLIPGIFSADLLGMCTGLAAVLPTAGALVGLDIGALPCEVADPLKLLVKSAVGAETMCSMLLPGIIDGNTQISSLWWEAQDWEDHTPWYLLPAPAAQLLQIAKAPETLCPALAAALATLPTGLSASAMCTQAGLCPSVSSKLQPLLAALLPEADGPEACSWCTSTLNSYLQEFSKIDARLAATGVKPTLSELLQSFSLPQQIFTEACVPTLTSLLDLASTSAALQLPSVATAACTAVGRLLKPAPELMSADVASICEAAKSLLDMDADCLAVDYVLSMAGNEGFCNAMAMNLLSGGSVAMPAGAGYCNTVSRALAGQCPAQTTADTCAATGCGWCDSSREGGFTPINTPTTTATVPQVEFTAYFTTFTLDTWTEAALTAYKQQIQASIKSVETEVTLGTPRAGSVYQPTAVNFLVASYNEDAATAFMAALTENPAAVLPASIYGSVVISGIRLSTVNRATPSAGAAGDDSSSTNIGAIVGGVVGGVVGLALITAVGVLIWRRRRQGTRPRRSFDADAPQSPPGPPEPAATTPVAAVKAGEAMVPIPYGAKSNVALQACAQPVQV